MCKVFTRKAAPDKGFRHLIHLGHLSAVRPRMYYTHSTCFFSRARTR